MRTLIAFLTFLLIIIQYVESIRLLDIVVPSTVSIAGDAMLSCNFDLEGAQLYAIKWYKDKQEFYRYLPGENPPVKVFPTEGIDIDMEKSNKGNIFLRNINLRSSGVYKCEVSGESPFFQTNLQEKRMIVHVYPRSRPKIKGSRRKYYPGDVVDVTCTSEPSNPPAKLIWYINGRKANERYLTEKIERSPSGLTKSILRLRFQVEKRDIISGNLALKCSLIGQKYNRSREASLHGKYSQSSVLLLPEKSKAGDQPHAVMNGKDHNGKRKLLVKLTSLCFCLISSWIARQI